MADIVTLAASVNDIPSMSETDAMLEELRRLPRTVETANLIDGLLDFRSLLAISTDPAREA
ncbi:conserved hypothetical protein [Frankia canadensis]|uniref:Pterin-binding domain-containing protein n=1 Tax=Frankia canadensis TaxID=1836972 RepID=A0A2I2KY19_9ACTN|nr:hypothetical protein [Frankia canadensis]SNQ50553.1 conserved hypothetical protein [Frankia canadensis]SOU57843.1 conserved hypothetical protein [Frankia canadensis]